MNGTLSKAEIGERIADLRKLKGLTQEDLAKSVKISRTSLTQIELGKRSVDILELKELSDVLRFSLDDFMSKDFMPNQEIAIKEGKKSKKQKERISTPIFQVDKFINVFLYMLERCAGKPNIGETMLYRLLYFSDFNHYEIYEEHLSGATYRKLHYGPVTENMDAIIQQMVEKKHVQRLKTTFNGIPLTRYIPLKKANLTLLKASEKEVIDRVIEQMSDWSATAISNYAHKDMPWLASKDGEEISYELVFYREAPFTVRNYGDEMQSK